MNKQLRLTIYSLYFVKILTGEKTIEYRKKSELYKKKFQKHWDEILFINGYGKSRPHMIMELTKIIETKKNFELHLGKVIRCWNIQEPKSTKEVKSNG